MGPDFGDFLSQIPAFPIFIFCGSAILLLVSIVALVRVRAMKASQQFVSPMPSPTYAYTAPDSSGASADLPDLDALVTAPPAATPPPAAKGITLTGLSDGSQAQTVEVMTLMRDVVNGGLIIQMGGKTYRDLSADEDFRSSFLKIMRELSPVVKGTPAPAVAAEADAPPPPAEKPAALPTVRDVINSAPPPAAPSPRPPSAPVPGTALPHYSIDDQPAQPAKRGLFGRGKLDLPPVPELDIAGRIEAYLQHKLRSVPEYAGRSIHVHPAPDGGVSIEVDGIFYEAVGDIANEEVRRFLSETIQEWQQSQ